MNRATFFLCEDIVIEILTRLPVKSLVRFMAVCRFWKSIITSPQVVHLQVSKPRPTKLSVHTDQKCYALVEEDGENLVLSETSDFPFKKLNYRLHEAATVVGIRIRDPNGVGKGGKPSRFIIIWNPSIRKHAVIPMNPVGEPDYTYTDGFGATMITSDSDYDYKYVRIAGFFFIHGDGFGLQPAAVEIYSWKTGTWRKIDLDLDLYGHKRFSHHSASLLRGRLHWAVRDRKRSSHSINSISAFDLEEEVFDDYDIMLPECLSSDTDYLYRANLFVIKESLLAMIVDEKEAPNCSVIWVMQEYGYVESWTKFIRVDTTASALIDVYLLKNGELLLGLHSKLVKYNPKTRKAADIG